ncbi:C40 family peptidase [Halomonas caseinilytica]|uniref:C40 family peptidase n=1 Tax=Halomonas caseinilytica TaxID=438744 RepID=UPI0008BF9404|nr:NlpC/P60 family protein [Halomonas caseinilytica]SEM50350.1 NlpC/P60 family protein [Halomonas caseinilytica]
MINPTSRRLVSVALSCVMLAGCAASGGSSSPDEPVDNYFARDLPGLPEGYGPMMSPADNPIRQARQLGNPPPTLIRQALLAQHERWLGTPYRLGGTSRRGVDCSALVQNIFADTFRLEIPRTTARQIHEGRRVSRDELRPGDLVFFRPPGAYRHVGIYVGDGRFLHASTSRGVKLSSLDNPYWQRYYWQSRRALDTQHLAQRLDSSVIASSEG